VDGTLNYSRELPIWCISVSLFRGQLPEVGVIHDPIRQETFEAAVGAGAKLNKATVRSSGCRDMSQALVHVTVDFRQDSLLQGLDDLKVLAPVVLRTRNIGSAALALAYVAVGRFDAMLHRFASPWDYGAGVALVQEAGGVVTDLAGKPYSYDTTALLASASEELHETLLELLKSS
jgi:myo-inositol-1(or 4)-monophosphatase